MVWSDLRFRLGTRRLRRRRIAFYRTFIRRGDLCFDVGANRGDRVELFLAMGARVVAVEPQTVCRQKLVTSFGEDPRFTLVGAAAGPAPGEAELLEPSPGSGLASMSREWIDRVRASGRFTHFEWTATEHVEMTTLDVLVAEHGEPAFCKIDVEGFEYDVLLGLSRALPALSLEFTPEHLDATERCVSRLAQLGDYELNYVVNDALSFAEGSWLAPSAFVERLVESTTGSAVFGDVYARLRSSSNTAR